MRQSEVGDFLASLTAIETTSGGVQSVSFEVPEPPEPPPQPAQPRPDGPFAAAPRPPGAQPAAESEEDQEPDDPRVDVHLRLAHDGDHDVTVAYVVGAPIWRPSYRVVLDRDQRALLQAWAVVQNVSGEDWHDVQLSLTTGAPIAFQSDLGTPVTPDRPMVTDEGEVVMAVPESQTALAQNGGEADEPSAQGAATGATDESTDDYDGEEQRQATRGRSSRRDRAPSRAASTTRARPPAAAQPGDYGGMPAPATPAQIVSGITANQLQQNVTAMAAIAVLGESVTRYDIHDTVTVPDGGSTMVAVLSQRVPGGEAHLFSPDPGVPPSAVHPFRAARIVNRTGAILERGPISVLGDGSFLGQGVLDSLPRGATAFVPFAVDRSVAVRAAQELAEQEGRLVRMTRSAVVVERFSQRTTMYEVRNGGAKAIDLYVRHARMDGANLFEPPEGTEMTATSALVPVHVRAHGEGTLRVVERTPVQRSMDFMTSIAADAVALYLQGPAVDAAQGPALRRALEIRRQLLAAQERLAAASAERDQLSQAAAEARQNLEAIRNVPSAGDLRARLVRRISDTDARMASSRARSSTRRPPRAS